MLPALFALARPAMFPILLVLPALGWGYAHWLWRLPVPHPVAFLPLVPAFALLHAGSLWLNATLDRDEAPVLFGAPRPIPRHLSALALAGLALAPLPAALADPDAGLSVLLCSVLAVLYSHPRTAWKGHLLLGPLVNALGYGLLAPLAGFQAVGLPGRPASLALLPLLPIGLMAPYFLAQVHQERADRAAGYRTLVAMRGPRACVDAAILALSLALAGGLALAATGMVPARGALAAPGWMVVIAGIAAHRRQPEAKGPRLAAQTLGGMALCTLLTVALVA